MARALVYTAQSKQYFYCRDAVCQFVFRQGAVPLNPFRAFDYYLGGRVPREDVRAANRRMQEACDETWIFGRDLADGVLIEAALAIELGQRLRFFSIDADANLIQEISLQELDFEAEVITSSGRSKTFLLGQLRGGTPSTIVEALGRDREFRVV